MRRFTKIALVASAIGGAACLAKKVAEDEDVKEKFGKAKEAGMEFLKSVETKLSEKNAEEVEPDVSSEKERDIDYANATDFEGWTKDDIEKYAKAVMESSSPHSLDPFWDDTAKCLLCACVGLLVNYCSSKKEDASGPLTTEVKAVILENAKDLKADRTSLNLLLSMTDTKIGAIMKHIEDRYLDKCLFEMPYCVKMWHSFKLSPEKTRTIVIRDLYETLGVPMPKKSDDVPKVTQASGTSILSALAGNGTSEKPAEEPKTPGEVPENTQISGSTTSDTFTEDDMKEEAQESEVFFDDSTESVAEEAKEETKEEIRNVTGEENETPASDAPEVSDVAPKAEDITGEDMLRAIREINESNPDVDMANSDNNDEDWV